MSWFNNNNNNNDSTPSIDLDGVDIPTIEGCAPSDRGINVPNINTGYITFEEYKAAKCSYFLKLLYEQDEGEYVFKRGQSLAEMLEDGYQKDVLARGLIRD